MPMLRKLVLSAAGSVTLAAAAPAQTPAQPASWPRGGHAPGVPVVPCPTCPGGVMPAPGYQPSPYPAHPAYPSAPVAPVKPADPNAKKDPDPNAKKDPAAPTPPAPNPNPQQSPTDNLQSQAPDAGTGGGGSALPSVFGDLPGGSARPGPLPIRNGRALNGQPVIIVLPNGQRVNLSGGAAQAIATGALPGSTLPNLTPSGRPSDEGLGVRSPGVSGAIPADATSFTPPPGTRLDDSLAKLVSQVPEFQRGAFKITENDTPRPTTRAYFIYNFYDNVFQDVGGPGVPRINVHQETFGYEQAFADRQFSVGVRVPYNQVTSPGGFYNRTFLGDLTLISKAVLLEDRDTGNLLSAGLALTIPTGASPNVNTLTGTADRFTLIQPFLGYILTSGDFFFQGFTSVVVPTQDNDTVFLSNDLSVGYFAYRNPGATLSGIVPIAEVHINNPLNNRGDNPFFGDFPDQVTLLGGVYFQMHDRSQVGFACGAPLTGPRPFSLQATFNLSIGF